MSRNIGMAAMSVLLGLASAAVAGEKTAYLAISGGGNIPSGDLQKSDISDSNTGLPIPDYDISLNTGWNASVALGGYLFSDAMRLEFQYTAQENDFDKFKEQDGTKASGSGTLHSNLFMLNAYYDIPLAKRLSAYVGGGVGALYITHEGDSDPSPIYGHDISGQHGTSFAYEAMAGVEYQLTPIMSVFTGYRGWSATDLDTQQATLDFPWFNSLEIGLRMSF